MLKNLSQKIIITLLVGVFFVAIGSKSYADESEDGSSTFSSEDSSTTTMPSEETMPGSDDELQSDE